MSGAGVFSGADYQASVIAYVYVHILTGAKLRWLSDRDDIPTAVSGETRGPGDDARIEFGADAPPAEVQAKHGLKRDERLTQAFRKVRDSEDTRSDVFLVVDSSSSRTITFDLARQLVRLRAGRSDDIGQPVKSLLKDLGTDACKTLCRVRIAVLDLDVGSIGRDAKRATELLADNLRDPNKAAAAWDVLVADGSRLCANKSRRNRNQLVTLLKSRGITALPPRKTRRWHEDLRLSKRQLDSGEPEAALALLDEVEAELATGKPDGSVLYRLNQHKAAACVQLHRLQEAKAFARRALDHDPKGIQAMASLVQVHALGGDTAEAGELADRMLELHPNTPMAWLARVQVSCLTKEAPPEVPVAVADDSEFRKGWTNICLSCGRIAEAQEESARLIAEGDRSSSALLLRAGALLADIDQLTTKPRRERADEVNRLCSEVVDRSDDASDLYLGHALRLRSRAHTVREDSSAARDDIERAFLLRPNDHETIVATALARLNAQDALGALTVLSHPVVDSDAHLLAIRAGARAEANDRDGAKRDLETASGLPYPNEDAVRLTLVEAALALGDQSLAARYLSDVSEDAKKSVQGRLMQARLAARENDLSGAEPHYRDAAALSPGLHDGILAELGVMLVRDGSFHEAVSAFKEAHVVPDNALPAFVHALMSLKRFSEAQDVINALITRGDAPSWAFDHAARIALHADDPERAAKNLEQLVARDKANHNAKLALTQTLLELDLTERAAGHAEELRHVEGLSALEQMGLAQVFLALKRSKEAMEFAYAAYRKSHRSAEINRTFVWVVMNSGSVPKEFDRVGAGTHVRLVRNDGDVIDYIVLQENDERPLLEHEITFEAATSAGLVGLRRDDAVVRNEGTWMEETWRVSEIEQDVQFAYNRVFSEYPTKFPSEDFFVKGFQIASENPTAADLGPLISAVHERERLIERIAKQYQKHVLPLEMLARLAGISVVDFMLCLQEAAAMPPLFVEFRGKDAAIAAQSAAREADCVVLTRTALVSLWQLGVQDESARVFHLMAPRALRTQVRVELENSEKEVRDGRKTLGRDDTGLAAHEVQAGHPTLVHRRDDLRSQLRWLEESVEIRSRPLEAFGDPSRSDERMRARIGSASYDGLELARAVDATLYADDLGVRKLAANQSVPSFSSVALVPELSERAAVSAADQDRLLVDLVERHYVTVQVTAEMLGESLSETRQQSSIGTVFSAFAVSVGSVEEGAATLMQTIRQEALKPITIRSTREITRHGVEGLSIRFSKLDVVRALERTVVEQLALLPKELDAVHEVCQKVRQSIAGP